MPNVHTIDVPVLIVGAGPTGLLTANLLGTYGIECLVIERNAAISNHPKAILLDDEGLRALQAVGLADDVISKVILGYGARYYEPDGTCFAAVDAPVTENGFPRRNSFLQPDLERALLQGLQRFQCVGCMFSTQFEGFSPAESEIQATAKTTDGALTINAQVLLGCDGGRSTVREQLDIKMVGRTDSRDWVVVDTVNDPDTDRFSKFFCDPKRPMVSIPAPGGGRRYEYMIMPGEDPKTLGSPEMVRQTLRKFRSIPDEDVTRAVVYTFHARVADRLHVDNALLLGDAAHLSPPFAGQGMNAGLRDAFNVAWKVAQVTGKGAPASILATYESERRAPIEEMIDYAVSLGEIVMPVGNFDDNTRTQILDALIPSRQDGGTDGVLQPKPQAAYRSGWITRALGEDQSMVGRPLPQPQVLTPAGTTCLLDDALGPGFSLVGMELEDPHALKAAATGNYAPLNPTAISLQPWCNTRSSSVFTVTEESPTPMPGLKNQILLVRPDRFVAAQIDPQRVQETCPLLAGLGIAG